MAQVNVGKAHDELIDKLSSRLKVTRSEYTKALEEVQKKHGLRQGHPQFLEWVLTCVGRSPIIIEDEEGAGENE